jgi:undecaprenyl-diphosphatase
MLTIDIKFLHLLYGLSNKTALKFFSIITWLGKWWVIFVLAAVFSLWLWQRKEKIKILCLWVALIGAEASAFLGKIIFARPRPELAVHTETSASFPSAHAVSAMVFYGFLVWIFGLKAKNLKQKFVLLINGLFIILLVGFSRLYLRVHYLSDVLAGYLVGLLWLIISFYINKLLIQKTLTKRGENETKK